MFKKVWNVLLVIILILAAVWLLLFASNRSLTEKLPNQTNSSTQTTE